MIFGAPTPADAPWDPCRVGTPPDVGASPPDPDSDCDGIADDVDTVWNPPDCDNDGFPDVMEDTNRNGIIDPGETDPCTADTNGDGVVNLWDYPDKDKDCLPDMVEDRNRDGEANSGETNWEDEDHDDDGWVDGPCNATTLLYLTAIEVLDQQEDIELGKDELFLTVNHARHPLHMSADGRWSLREQTLSFNPWLPIAVRARGAVERPYMVRLSIREDDWFDWTDDDMILDRDVTFGDQGSFILEHKEGGGFLSNEIHYRFHFTAVRSWMADPHPLDSTADEDRDGLTEEVEHSAIHALTIVGNPISPDIYGVGHPMLPDIYMEMD